MRNETVVARDRAVLFLGLCELVESRLASSKNYAYAVDALNLAWGWVAGHDVTGSALADMGYDEAGFGVGGSMAVETDHDLLPVWGCIDLAVSLTAFAAYLAEGKTTKQMNEDVAEVDSEECRDQFASWFSSLIPLNTLPDHYRTALDGLPKESITRSAVRDCAFAALHVAAADSVELR